MLLLQHRAILDSYMEPIPDGNWDDTTEEMENLGFQQGSEAQIGGVVDMGDDVYLVFDD
jgi:hypothetical protein